MSYAKALKEVSERKNEKVSSIGKKEIIDICKFNKKEIENFNVLALLAHVKDERNVSDDFIHYCFNNFYAEISRRYKLSIDDVRYLWDDEVKDLLEGKKKFVKKYFKDKKAFCSAITTVRKNKVSVHYEIGKEAKKILAKVCASDNKREKAPIKKLEGTIASTGVAIGKAKLIRTYSDINKIKKGDILVAYMTSQKFMPAIMKAGAIVTNEGGLTCHAAIVAREVKKPCIIGTKFAMETLKDGDLVKVDANKGVVEILNK